MHIEIDNRYMKRDQDNELTNKALEENSRGGRVNRSKISFSGNEFRGT